MDIKAPVTNWMTYDEYNAYYKEWYPDFGLASYTCTSSDVSSLWLDNKAGKDGTCLAFHRIQTEYGFDEADVRSRQKKTKKADILRAI